MKSVAWGGKGARKRLLEFAGTAVPPREICTTVEDILREVAVRGDEAVLEYTEKFDRASMTVSQLRVDPADLAAAARRLPKADRAAFRESIAAVTEFHKKSLPKGWLSRNRHGARVGERFDPLLRVGLYIPGGSVPLVSTVIMTAVLARIAGVPEIAVATPPDREGKVNESLLAALHMVGIREVYRMGGVQAMGALAYGTRTIAPVLKLFGPGNAYVMEAKRQLYGVVGVDLLPGPSELMIIADESANPDWVAADLLAQGEHGSGKEKLYLVSYSRELTSRVQASCREQLKERSHADKLRKILKDGWVTIQVGDDGEAAEVANLIGPEHLEIQTSPERVRLLSRSIVTAGALLLGHHTPAAVGDFAAGPSHTLPTNRAGRFLSGLQISDFFRRSSILEYTPSALAKAAPVVEAFARMESLDAHGASVAKRV